MRIVYVGEMLHGSTSAMRRDALLRLGHDVETLDTSPPRGYSTTRRTLAMRVWSRLVDVPRLRAGLRRRLLDAVGRAPCDLIYVDKGLFVEREWLAELRALHPRVVLAHFNPDDPFAGAASSAWKTFVEALPEYDVHFVPRRENVPEYQAAGARRVLFQLPSRGFDPEVHRPYGAIEAEPSRYGSRLCFIGGVEAERKESLEAVLVAGLPLTIWGNDWGSSGPLGRAVIRPAVYHHEYGKAVSGSAIALGFLRKLNRDGHTSRSIEIPACGSMLLAERTADHLELFQEGKEAEFFGSNEELVDKARWYLANEQTRSEIARAGRQRCQSGGYDYLSLMRERVRISMGREEC